MTRPNQPKRFTVRYERTSPSGNQVHEIKEVNAITRDEAESKIRRAVFNAVNVRAERKY